MSGQVKECVLYFKGKPGFDQLFRGIRDKYRSLGYIGGTVMVTLTSQAEREAFEGFFQKKFGKSKNVKISLSDMEKKLALSKFSGVSVFQVLEGYFAEDILTKKEERRAFLSHRERLWEELIQQFTGTFSGVWLQNVYMQKGQDFLDISHIYIDNDGNNGGKKQAEFTTILQAANTLPVHTQTVEQLAVFAAKTTGDPHFFDEKTAANRILSMMAKAYHPSEKHLHKMNCFIPSGC